MAMTPPIPDALRRRAYWVDPGRFMAGAMPGAPDLTAAEAKIDALHEAGIRHIVSLVEPDERDHSGQLFASYVELCERIGISVAPFPIPDVTAPSVALTRQILDDVDRALASSRPVYVHCWSGRGRTGVVVGCWLVEHGRAAPAAAVTAIAELRWHCADAASPSPETPAQVTRVTGWALRAAEAEVAAGTSPPE